MSTNPTRWKPLSVRYGGRWKHFVWWTTLVRERIAFKIAPWLDFRKRKSS